MSGRAQHSLFDGPYNIVYADPPWQYRDSCNAGNRGACYKYDVMSLADICALDVASLAARDCLLAMWWVNPMPDDALAVVRAWGFELKTMAGFTWVKTTKHGKWHWGMGHRTRANTECCLLATKGRPRVIDHGVHQLVVAMKREHSQKPDEVPDRLVQLMGDVPRIELFARTKRRGWHAWGNEVESDIEIGTTLPQTVAQRRAE